MNINRYIRYSVKYSSLLFVVQSLEVNCVTMLCSTMTAIQALLS